MKTLQACVLSALTAVGATAASAQTTIVFNNFLSPTDELWADVMLPWTAEIEAVTEGRVTFVVPGSSLGPPPELLNMVRAGVADGAFQMVSFLREAHPELQLPLLPMTYYGDVATSVALWRTYESRMADANPMADVELLGLVTVPPGSLLNLRPEAFGSLADLSGVRMWALPGLAAETMSALGTAVTPGPAVQMYEVISGGVVDAFCCIDYGTVEAFNVSQYVRSVTEVPASIFAPAFAVFLSSEIWSEISPEDQEAIRAVSGEALARRVAGFDADNEAARQRFIEAGIPIEMASEAFVAEIEAAVEPVREAWFASVEQLGIDGRAALDFYLAEQARVNAED